MKNHNDPLTSLLLRTEKVGPNQVKWLTCITEKQNWELTQFAKLRSAFPERVLPAEGPQHRAWCLEHDQARGCIILSTQLHTWQLFLENITLKCGWPLPASTNGPAKASCKPTRGVKHGPHVGQIVVRCQVQGQELYCVLIRTRSVSSSGCVRVFLMLCILLPGLPGWPGAVVRD